MTEIGHKQKENFTSYLKCLDSAEETSDYDFYSPALLNGEIEAARVKNVHLYVAQKIKAQSKKKKSKLHQSTRTGLLIITNFRLSFVAFESDDKHDKSKKNATFQENILLGLYDVTLSNIDEIYAYTDKKQRLVLPSQKNASKIDAIRIVCKNFRMLTFTFEDAEVGKGKYIADALLKFAFPARHSLLFMYQYKEKYYNTTRSIRTFREKHDWTQELERCGISTETGPWRVLSNDCPSAESALPRYYVVPRKMTDSEYFRVCDSFRCKRGAIWVWGIGNASLVRMADLLPDLLKDETSAQKKMENLMIEYVATCREERSKPEIMELTKGLPSISDVFQSYMKLRALCVPASDRELTIQDQRFFTHLEKTSWLLYVSLCIKTANDAAKFLREGKTVVLQENDGRDLSCLVSSLVQVLLDPFYRTITGFQVLIQKEWIALGHPFCDRIGHIYTKQADRSPVFLLFLDCVWQTLQQCPESFEFAETFLTTIWDCVYISIFDTFQFNCEYDRYVAERDDNLISRPVWDWGEIFTDKDIALFSNPLYKKPHMSEQEIENHRKSKLPAGAMKLPGLEGMLAMKPKQPKPRYSLQPNSSIDLDAKLLLPSQLMNHQTNVKLEQPKIEKLTIASELQQPAEKYLTPSHKVYDLEIFAQCYYRWMPILEIRSGGAAQIDLFNRMILTSINKLQRAIENGEPNMSELQSEGTCKIPNVNSYFPFSMTNGGDDDATNLHDILIDSSDIITEGSLYDE